MAGCVNGIRNDRWDHCRLNRDDHCDELIHEGTFADDYRMYFRAHAELTRILDPMLMRVEEKSNGSEAIQVEQIIGLRLRVVAGGCRGG